MEHPAGGSALVLDNASALSVTAGTSNLAMYAGDVRELEIQVALVLHLLSNLGASPSQDPSPHPQTKIEDPWGWLSPTSLTTAVEDTVVVVSHVVRHLGA